MDIPLGLKGAIVNWVWTEGNIPVIPYTNPAETAKVVSMFKQAHDYYGAYKTYVQHYMQWHDITQGGKTEYRLRPGQQNYFQLLQANGLAPCNYIVTSLIDPSDKYASLMQPYAVIDESGNIRSQDFLGVQAMEIDNWHSDQPWAAYINNVHTPALTSGVECSYYDAPIGTRADYKITSSHTGEDCKNMGVSRFVA